MTRHKRVLMVIAPAQFRDEELFEPRSILVRRGAEVLVASTRAGTSEGMMGGSYEVSETVDRLSGDDWDAVVVVGGMGSADYLWDDPDVHRILREAREANRICAGICLSGAVLAKAGVLKDKTATVWATPESVHALREGGATYVKRDVVEDGRVITADGPHAAVAFAEAIARALDLT